MIRSAWTFSVFVILLAGIVSTGVGAPIHNDPAAQTKAAEAMGREIPYTLDDADITAFVRKLSLTEMVRRATEGMPFSEKARENTIADLESVYFKSVKEYLKEFDDFEFVNVKRVSGSPVITIRIVKKDLFFNYLHLTVGFLGNGEPRIVDFFDRFEGEPMSDRLRRSAGIISAQSASADSPLKAEWGEWATHSSDVHKINKMSRLNEHAEVLALQKRLPPQLLNHKSMQVVRLLAIFSVDRPSFPEVAREFERRFPGDATSALFNYYAAQLTKDPEIVLKAIDQLEHHYGDTNYCNFLRAVRHTLSNDRQKALEYVQPMIPKYRNYERITRLCSVLMAQLGKNDELAKLLREIERDTEQEMYSVIRRNSAMQSFLRSEAAKRWLSSPIKRPVAAELAPEVEALLADKPAPAPVATAAPVPAPAVPAAPAKPVPPPPRFQLKAILFSKKSPSALINGKSVFIGEKVDGAIVSKIDETSVTLEVDGKSEVITLK